MPTLDLLAGEPVKLAEERKKVWGLLGGSDTLQTTVARIFGEDDDDYSARGEDDDSSYGPDSYYTRAMGKDD